MTIHDRGVIDYSNVTDSYEMEIDNRCHFVDVSAAYEGGMLWRKPEQIVYNPIFGTNLENDPNLPTRDVSFWNDTKTIQFITHNGGIEIWAPFREILATATVSNVQPAYCNLSPPNCVFDASEIASSDLEVLPLTVDSPLVNPGTTVHPQYTLHIHRPKRTSTGVKRPVVIMVPGGTSPGAIFDAVDYDTGKSKAEYIASRGYIAIHWDADGRGTCAPTIGDTGLVVRGGSEDYNGYRQQDGLAEIIRTIAALPYVDIKSIGILAYDFGLAMAVGAVARHSDCNDIINYIIDHEGLISRVDIGNCGRDYPTDIQHDCADNDWWNERETIAHVRDIKCRYLRVQYETVDPTYYEFIRDYLNIIVTEGVSPWVNINDRNTLNHIYGPYDIPYIFPTGTNIANTLRKSIAEMSSLGIITIPNDIHIISSTNVAIDLEVSEEITCGDILCGGMASSGKIPVPLSFNQFKVKSYSSSYGATQYTTAAPLYAKQSIISSLIDIDTLNQTIDATIRDAIYSLDYQQATDYGVKQIYSIIDYTAPMELTVRPKLMLSTFIDAVKPFGYVDPITGKCEFPGNLAYLCYGKALMTSISTLHGSSQYRVRHNINCLLMSEVSQRGYPFSANFGTVINNHVIVQRFNDPFTQLNGDIRQLKKVRTNVAAWKPLTYSMRISPDLATVKTLPLTETSSLVAMKRNSFPVFIMELPVKRNTVTETLAHFIEYSSTNPVPAADISMFLVGMDALSTQALATLHFKIVLYKDGKIPLCIYYKPDDFIVIPINTSGLEIPLGTMGWGMRQRFMFIFDNPTAAVGTYKFTMRFKSTMPSTFGDTCFGDFFHFTEYVDEIPLQINMVNP